MRSTSAIADADHQVDIGIAPVKVRQMGHDDEMRDARGHINPQAPLRPRDRLAQGGFTMFDEGENFPALRQILHPFRGKAHPPCGPVQQPYLQVFFKVLMVLVTVEAGRERVSAARTKLPASATRINICIA